MEPYMHIVQYYETDKMGITHHSNYIRWMEEARIVRREQASMLF
jgi:acyl-CoA thioester hydrolase